MSDTNAEVAGVTITHPNRVLWPDAGLTKVELARYYVAIAPKLLKYSGDRPISLVRCPRGPGKQCFFQRHPGENPGGHVRSVKVSGRGDGKPFIFINDIEGLVSLVQMGTIEVHAWNAPVASVKKPDRLIFDLDPSETIEWAAIQGAARCLRAELKKLGLVSFLKTTGGKGLHVVVPFAPGPNWAETKAFARAFSDSIVRAQPDHYTINNRLEARKGLIFIDYLRNDETASAVAAYSVRARPGAPVSMPIEWAELSRVGGGNAFTVREALRRRKDAWADMHKASYQRLPPVDTLTKTQSSR